MNSIRRGLAAISALVFGLSLAQAAVGATASAALPTLAVPTVKAAPPLDPAAGTDGWKEAATVSLPWDVQHQRRSSEATTARIATDNTNLYVRFDVQQREPLLAQQHTNNVGDGTDDEVWIDVWPDGNAGFYYQFAATSNGTHYQYSSENTAYAPTWESHGALVPGGFVVTMRIPLKVMRSNSRHDVWRVEFVRIVRSSGERQLWAWDPQQTNGDDVRFAGSLTGMGAIVATRPQPRVGVYSLGAVGAPASGLTTSRMGADFSIPVTPTSSIYGTIHPDFSNVEVDQQTISPTAYQRVFTEVRPFFTQGAQFYENFNCDACPFISQLYTPAIPTPRDGYAFEGKQGRLQFAGFDAVGDNRNDGAGALGYSTPDNHWNLAMQTVAANVGGVTDHVQTDGLAYNDGKHISGYFNYGNDTGTNVLDGRQAQRYDFGTYYYTNTFGAAFATRKVGLYYNPVDGLVQHPDIAGYAAYVNKIWLFGGHSKLNSMQFGGFVDRYHDHTGVLDQTDNSVWVDFLTKNLIDVNAFVGSAYLLLPSGIFTPISQNGIAATWHSGSANNPGSNAFHGSSATPTQIVWNTGRFGPGRLDTWLRNTTMRAGPRGTLSLEADDTTQYLDGGGRRIQWLERVAYNYALGADSSIAIGIRRITGAQPIIDLSQPAPATLKANNVSFAYHRRTPHDEWYFAYGDASQLYTVPQWIVKWIHYVGAEKGT